MWYFVEDIGFIVICVGIVASFTCASISSYSRYKMLKHIKATNYKWWKELLAWPMSNIGELEYSEEETGDPIVNALRNKILKYRKLLVISVAIMIIGFSLFYLSSWSQTNG